MVQAIIPLGYSATQAEIDAGVFNAKSGGTIQVVNSNGQPTGVQYDVGAAGSAPTQSVTGGNINTILQAAGGAGWEKAQATTVSYVITRPTSGASLDLHIEVGGTLAALAVANWPIPASGVDQLRIRNMSAVAQSFTVSGFSGLVTADGNAATSGSYSIPVDMAVHITIDEDGWIQVAPMGQEVSQAEMDAALALKAAATSLTDGSIHAVFESIRADGVTFLTAATDPKDIVGTGWFNVENPVGLPAGWYYIFNAVHRNSSAVDATYSFQLAKRLNSSTVNNLLMRVEAAGTYSPWRTFANADGTISLGTGQTLDAQVAAIADIVNMFANVSSTATSTITTTDIVARFARAGFPSTKYGNTMDVVIGSHTAGIAGSTQVDLRLNNGNTASPDMTVLTLRGDGQVLVSANPTAALGVVTKQYADGLVVGLLDYRGAFTPAVSSGAAGYPTTGGSGTAGAILKGDVFVASAAGFILTEAIQSGDSVLAKIDTPGQTAANWDKLNANIAYVPEDQASKVTAFSTPTDTQYPSAKLTFDQLALKANTANVPALSSTAPLVDGVAAVGTGTTSARADHVHPTNSGLAPLASPTFTGTVIADGTVRLGNGQNAGDSGTAIADATTVFPSTASTATTTIATTDTALRLNRAGTAGTKWGNALDINIGSHTAGINAQTQIDFRMSNGGVATPDMTALTLRADGTTLVYGNPKLGSNAAHAQRSFSDITGVTMMMTPTTGTNTSTIDTAADVAARFIKAGTAGTKSNASLDIVVGSYAAGTAPATQVDFRLGASGNTPTATVMTLRSDGVVVLNGSIPKTDGNVLTGGGTLVTGTTTITLAGVATTSRIIVTKTGGVATGVLRVSAKASGSFTVTSSDGADTGTFDYVVFN